MGRTSSKGSFMDKVFNIEKTHIRRPSKGTELPC